MKFVSIDEVKVEDMSLDALKKFLHENAFFKFMDSGRQGLQYGAEDAIDNFCTWIQKRGPFGRDVLRKDIPLQEYHVLRNAARAAMVDGLIMAGSAGVGFAISDIYLMTLDAIIEAKEKS
jgi:hypothetical protein